VERVVRLHSCPWRQGRGDGPGVHDDDLGPRRDGQDGHGRVLGRARLRVDGELGAAREEDRRGRLRRSDVPAQLLQERQRGGAVRRWEGAGGGAPHLQQRGGVVNGRELDAAAGAAAREVDGGRAAEAADEK